MKKNFSLCAIMMLLLVILLCGCGQDPIHTNPTVPVNTTEETTAPENVLRVLTEDTDMLYTVERVISRFKELRPDIAIELEVLPRTTIMEPDNGELRNLMLERLRTEILAGKGPDVYLMHPYAKVRTDDDLFPDVQLAIRNGMFKDISALYDADSDLETEKLHPDIMNAGIYDGGRYVLPLAFDFPIAYVDVAQFEARGGNMDIFNGTIADINKFALQSGNPQLCTDVTVDTSPCGLTTNFFPQIVDYDTGEVLLTTEDMVPLLEDFQTVRAAQVIEELDRGALTNDMLGLEWFVQEDETWNDYRSMFINNTSQFMSVAAQRKIWQQEIAMLPVRAIDGDMVADVTYYGAVDWGCDRPELAYEFLRLFLTDEAQYNMRNNLRPLSYGVPVRVGGDMTPTWEVVRYRLLHVNQEAYAEWDTPKRELYMDRYNQLKVHMLTEEDYDILHTPFDRVQFSTTLDIDFCQNVYEPLAWGNSAPAGDIDITAAVESWLKDLQWFLAEG